MFRELLQGIGMNMPYRIHSVKYFRFPYETGNNSIDNNKNCAILIPNLRSFTHVKSTMREKKVHNNAKYHVSKQQLASIE